MLKEACSSRKNGGLDGDLPKGKPLGLSHVHGAHGPGAQGPTCQKAPFRAVLLVLALTILAAGFFFWLIAGANRGWTKTRVPVTKLDEVTGIEGIEYQKRFVPGVDFLGVAMLGAGVLAGASMVCGSKQRQLKSEP